MKRMLKKLRAGLFAGLALLLPAGGAFIGFTAVGTDSAQADVRYSYPRTRSGGLYAFCQNNGCGYPAAHRYCRRRGHPGARQFRPFRVNNCVGRRCIAFRWIRCIGNRYGGFNRPYRGFRRTFYAPRFNGAVVDHCLWWATRCGSPAAHSFCRRVGFTRAISYSRFRPGRTWVLNSRRFCNGGGCVGFRQVTCIR